MIIYELTDPCYEWYNAHSLIGSNIVPVNTRLRWVPNTTEYGSRTQEIYHECRSLLATVPTIYTVFRKQS